MTNREIENLTAPGEFQFCKSCGLLMVVGNGFCGKCSASEPDDSELVHNILTRQRAYIAKLRHDQGVPPLFWMQKEKL